MYKIFRTKRGLLISLVCDPPLHKTYAQSEWTEDYEGMGLFVFESFSEAFNEMIKLHAGKYEIWRVECEDFISKIGGKTKNQWEKWPDGTSLYRRVRPVERLIGLDKITKIPNSKEIWTNHCIVEVKQYEI